MKVTKRLIVAFVTLLATVHQIAAIEGMIAKLDGENVVISWPSTGTENYLIQHRSSLDAGEPWTNLTNNYPAATGTNRTTYIIYGIATPPAMLMGGGGGSGGNGGASALLAANSQAAEMEITDEPQQFIPWFDRWQFQDRKPNIWESEKRPPFPWEAQIWNLTMSPLFLTPQQASFSVQSGASLLTTATEMGFFRVFHVPTWQPEFNGATVDGFTFVRADHKDYAERVVASEVLVDGTPTDFAARNNRTFSGVPYEGTDFFFDRMNNGTHQFRLLSTLRLEDELSETGQHPTLVLTSKVFTATISNPVLFTNWEDSAIGSTTVFEAYSVVPNVDWTIDVYDVVGDFVISQSGHSASGKIVWTWDLHDFSGTLRNDWGYDPVFQSWITIVPPGIQAAAAQQVPMPKKSLDYPLDGKWLIVYQDREKRPGARTDYIEAMNEVAGGPAFWDDLENTLMLRYGTEYTQTQRNDDWTQFRAYLTGSGVRNFYYQGHGSPSTIGGDFDVVNANGEITGATFGAGSKASISAEWVEKNVTKNKYTGYRHFRFVFLDGCETSKGNWPGAFNVPKATNTINYYTAPGRKPNSRPSAFVGWEKIVGGTREWGFTSGYRGFRGDWMAHWSLQFENLNQAVVNARVESGWITQQTMDGALRIYGLNTLGFQDYDSRSQWPGP